MSWAVQLSTEARIMAQPYTTYRMLGGDNASPPNVIRTALKLSIAFGAAASMLADGRLSIPLFIDGAVAWTIVPVLQSLIVLMTAMALRQRLHASRKIVSLFLAGNGPWITWLLLLAAVPIVMQSPKFVFFPATRSIILPATFGIVFVWAGVVRHAFFRCVVGMTSRSAVTAVLVYSVVLWGSVLTFLAFADVLHR